MGYKQGQSQVDEVAVAKAMRRHREKALRSADSPVPHGVGMGWPESKDTELQPPDRGEGWDDVNNKNE